MITLSPQQADAVRKIGHWFKHESEVKKVFKLGGFAGTGKSTILPDILEAVNLTADKIAFAGPTGKSSKVMGNKLRDQGINVYPTTIHSLIYQPKAQKASVLERELAEANNMLAMLSDGKVAPPTGNLKEDVHNTQQKITILRKDLDRAYDLNDLRFSLNPDSRLVSESIKLVILDEGSMIGEEIANDLLDFDIPILVMGDPGQLPPVLDKPGFFDGSMPDAFLTEVHRQAAENPIIRLATMVRKGERGDYGDYGDGVLIVPRRKDIYTLDLARDCQVLVGTNKTRWKLTSKMRREGGMTDPLPHAGEPLIMCKNHKQHASLVNGTAVFATEDHGDSYVEGSSRFLAKIADEDGKKYTAFTYQGLFEEHMKREKNYATASKSEAFRSRVNDAQIDFGWAITCHKAQGSEWEEVIVHDESGVFREDADKWLYTAITRAGKRLIIVD